MKNSNLWPQMTPEEASVVRLCSKELYRLSETQIDGNGQLEGNGSEDASLTGLLEGILKLRRGGIVRADRVGEHVRTLSIA
jgi:hypothetical protein